MGISIGDRLVQDAHTLSDLRDPDFDPDYMLDPERLIALEMGAESARKTLAEVPSSQLTLIRAWIQAELDVARKRALAVGDVDFSECVGIIERRLAEPGCFLRDAQASLKIQSVFEARSRFRVIDGGLSG